MLIFINNQILSPHCLHDSCIAPELVDSNCLIIALFNVNIFRVYFRLSLVFYLFISPKIFG